MLGLRSKKYCTVKLHMIWNFFEIMTFVLNVMPGGELGVAATAADVAVPGESEPVERT